MEGWLVSIAVLLLCLVAAYFNGKGKGKANVIDDLKKDTIRKQQREIAIKSRTGATSDNDTINRL